ncbi:MAG TPA: ATP-binding cassette domain-containing protein [Candidatus Wallbacteria bacterium]|nr:ATP-binding cassette domain-containing protein [Candidatus Wallbacteria bacterium]
MIEVRGLSVKAGNFSLEDIDLGIEAGKSHVIVGPTGSGKTLLLESIIGFRTPAAGNILISGEDVTKKTPHQRGISYVPQDICVFPNMSVLDNIRYPLKARAINFADYDSWIKELISFFNIGHILERFPANLSGGEKQRTALVRALVSKPALLVLDEPFSAIDQSMREDTRRMIKNINRKFSITILMVTHDIEEAYFIGDEISVMMLGKIIQSGPAFDMYNYPKDREMAKFLGVRNILAGSIQKVYEKAIDVSWPEGGGNITITCGCAGSKFTAGEKIEWGIRSEAVYILRADLAAASIKPNSFDASVDAIYSRGRLHTALVKTKCGAILEIDIHDTAARKLDLFSLKNLTISMNPDNIFILS